MKDYYLTTSPSGIGLIPKENMPVIPQRPIGCLDYVELDRRNYQADLQRAIFEAVPVVNLDKAHQIIWSKHPKAIMSLGDIYGPFTGEYEIKEVLSPGWVPSYNDPDNINGHPNAEPMQVAILSEPEEKEQSQSQKQSTWYPEWRKIVDAVLEPSKHPICRDCADGDGTCDLEDNLPCDPTDRVIEVFRRLKQMEKEPVKESQEDMLREILDNYRELQHWRKHEGSRESDESFILTELEKFTITRR